MTVRYPDGPQTATILVMNDASRLYLALAIPRAALGPGETVDFHFDNRHDGNSGDPGEDILRLSPSSGAVDMYYDGASTIYPDQRDGGTADIDGSARKMGR
jgi:hypothetical protein